METTTYAPSPWHLGRDKYGRSVHHLRAASGVVLGVVVKLKLTGGYFWTCWGTDRATTFDSPQLTLAAAKRGLLHHVALEIL